MKEIFKKQKRKIVIKITTVLLVVWLLVSSVFCVITLQSEKQTQLTKAHNDYNYLINATTEIAQPYNEICMYIQISKEQVVDIVKGVTEEEEITRGADIGTYDRNVHITLGEFPIFDEDESTTDVNKLIMDTDKEIFFDFSAEDFSEYTGNNGILNYDEFVASMTEDQLSSIRKYLNTEMDKDGYFYLLLNKDCYYNPENGHVYPKTIEIVKAYNDSFGFGVSETVETYDLNPKFTGGPQLYKSTQNEPCIIDGEFVCNNFASEGLIEDPFESLNYETYDPDTGIVEKTGLFSYQVLQGGTYTVSTIDFEGSELAFAYHNEQQVLYGSAEVIGEAENGDLVKIPDNPVQYVMKNVSIRYAKQINLLDYCSDTLIIGVCALFLFFLIIGLILSIMMCKVIKTQLSEEEKRREVTNALAHDIKTPLFIISGYAQNLKENINSEKREHYSDKIIERTNEVNELVHKMLDFTRLERLDSDIVKEPVDLYLLTKEISEKFSDSKIENEIRINKNGDSVITGNRELLTRALTNLLENAVRYSDENTPVIIEINDRTISFSNTCSSITQEDIKHLTQPYYRGEKNRQSKGNGLGLSIVKSIVDIHNFTLDITLKDNVITFMIKSK